MGISVDAAKKKHAEVLKNLLSMRTARQVKDG
jgi:hypothetical protein